MVGDRASLWLRTLCSEEGTKEARVTLGGWLRGIEPAGEGGPALIRKVLEAGWTSTECPGMGHTAALEGRELLLIGTH